jgi:hypothetical protein
LLVILALLGQEIIESNAPVLTDQAERDLFVREQTDQVRPRDIGNVSRLLCRQLRVDGKQGHCVALSNFGQNIFEKSQRGRRQDDLGAELRLVADVDAHV